MSRAKDTISFVITSVDNPSQASISSHSPSNNNQTHSFVQLPSINLHKFNDQYGQWLI